MRALRADDAEGVVYLGTFSKTFAAGVRVGWAVAPPAIRDKLILAAESAVLCHSSFSQLTVREYLNTQPWQEQIKDLPRTVPRAQGRHLERAVRDDAAGLSLDPAGRRVLRLARAPRRDQRQGHAAAGDLVAGRLRAGNRFLRRRLGRRVRPAVLLAPRPGPDYRGVRRLASVIENEIQLRDDFGPARRVRPPPDNQPKLGTDLEIMRDLERVVILAGGLSRRAGSLAALRTPGP
jgi:2-aminoadipate transaminase